MAGKGRAPKDRRARKGTGSIWEYRPGRFRGQIDLGFDANGKRLRPSATGASRREVQQKLNEIMKNFALGQYVAPDKLTVKEHFEEWLREKGRNTAPNTMSKYRNHTNNHIVPALGPVKLTELNYRHVNAFFDQLEAKKRKDGSPALVASTRSDIAAILSMGLNDAVRKGIIRENPVHKVEQPQAEDVPSRFMTPEEWDAWQEAAKGERLENLYHVGFHTGLRPSELLGLAWDNVDFDGRQIKVAQALHEDGPNIWIGPLKTPSSYRTISIGEAAVAALKRQRVLQVKQKLEAGTKWTRPDVERQYSNDLVFATSAGGWIWRSTIYRGDLARVRERTGLMDVGLHTLRHTHVAVLIHMGARPLDIKERLGHKDVAFTLQRYGHLFPKDDERTAQLMDAFVAQWAAGNRHT